VYVSTAEGPNKALKLIQDHKSIDAAVKTLDSTKYKFEADEFLYKEAAQLFKTPDVTNPDDVELVWKDCDEEGLIQFLCHEKGFSVERVQSGIKRLKDAKGKGTFMVLHRSCKRMCLLVCRLCISLSFLVHTVV